MSKEMYFSYFPEDNEFEEYDTLEEAKDSAQGSLDYYREDACNDGWSDSVGNVYYGKILGKPERCDEDSRANYTDEEWEEAFPYNSDNDEVCDYRLEALKEEPEVGLQAYISLLKDSLAGIMELQDENAIDLAGESLYYVIEMEKVLGEIDEVKK
jgi:hypothetical protein